MKIKDLFEGGDVEDSIAADLKRKFAKIKPAEKTASKPAAKDPHPDKSTIWKRGFDDGKARNPPDPKASSVYGPRTSEYEDGYEAGLNENTASSVASSMGSGNGFVNGGPGTIGRPGKKNARSKKK